MSLILGIEKDLIFAQIPSLRVNNSKCPKCKIALHATEKVVRLNPCAHLYCNSGCLEKIAVRPGACILCSSRVRLDEKRVRDCYEILAKRTTPLTTPSALPASDFIEKDYEDIKQLALIYGSVVVKRVVESHEKTVALIKEKQKAVANYSHLRVIGALFCSSLVFLGFTFFKRAL